MNTSTNTNQIHDITTRGTGMLHRGTAGALLAAAFAASAIGFAATSHADGPPSFGGFGRTGAGCQTEPFGFLGQQRRTLCDTPIAGDGSWSRQRTIWAPANYTTRSCSSSGSSSYSSPYTNCYGGVLHPRASDQRRDVPGAARDCTARRARPPGLDAVNPAAGAPLIVFSPNGAIHSTCYTTRLSPSTACDRSGLEALASGPVWSLSLA
jgi:hypothetical protein